MLAPVGVSRKYEAIIPAIKHSTEMTAEVIMTALKLLHTRIAERAGNKQSAHHAHTKYNGNCGQHGKQHIVKPGIGSGGFCKGLVKGDGKNSRIKQNKQREYGRRQYYAQNRIGTAEGKYASEHIAGNFGIHTGRERNRNDAYCKRGA